MKKLLAVPLQKTHGRVHHLDHLDEGTPWLQLLPPPTETEADGAEEEVVYLRYALTEMGTERPIFPALVLDDWGKERKGLGLYRWVREEGDMFPRAEVFGYTAVGQEEQIFLRDLELHVRYPVMVYPREGMALAEGRWLRHVVVVNTAVDTPTSYKNFTPENWPTSNIPQPTFPLNLAQVSWWHIPPTAVSTFTISQK